MQAGLGRSIAFLCRPDGTLLRVLLNEWGLSLTGMSFLDLVDANCSTRAIDFLRRLEQADAVLGERLHVINPNPGIVSFYGIRSVRGLVVFGTTAAAGDI